MDERKRASDMLPMRFRLAMARASDGLKTQAHASFPTISPSNNSGSLDASSNPGTTAESSCVARHRIVHPRAIKGRRHAVKSRVAAFHATDGRGCLHNA